jgi:hypothetical protein
MNNARAMLDAWRANGEHRANPVRFHLIDALEKRASAYEGEARRMLDERLAQLLEAYKRDIESMEVDSKASSDAPSPLATLLEDITKTSSPNEEWLDYFRAVWSKVSAEKQLRDSFAQVPKNAGPLNSSSLVHRTLSLMRESSPEYLQHFLAYIDALSWMDAMIGPMPTEAPAAKKSARKKK